MGWLNKFFGWLKNIFVRNGLDKFLSKYIDVAVEIVGGLAAVNNNADFHTWKDAAWLRVKEATGEVRGNWVAILVALAFENLKAKGEV